MRSSGSALSKEGKGDTYLNVFKFRWPQNLKGCGRKAKSDLCTGKIGTVGRIPAKANLTNLGNAATDISRLASPDTDQRGQPFAKTPILWSEEAEIELFEQRDMTFKLKDTFPAVKHDDGN